MRGPTSWGDGESCLGRGHCLKSGTPAMHCLTACRQCAVEFLLCIAPLPGGSCQGSSCSALPQCLRAVGSGIPAMQCHTVWGNWAVELLQCAGPPAGGSGRWNSCHALPHYPGPVGSGTPAMCGPTNRGDGESCPARVCCLKKELLQRTASGSGQWAVQLPQCTAHPLGGGGKWNSRNAQARQRGDAEFCPRGSRCLKSGTPSMHCHTAYTQWAVEFLLRNAPLPSPVGSAAPAMHCDTTWGQWAVEMLSCTITLLRRSGRCNSCNALPHCLGAVGGGTLAMRGPTSWADEESCPGGSGCLKLELLECIATLVGGSGQCNS